MPLKDHFLLDPEITYLNHGSFGACPEPVFKTYQDWQLQIEREPVDFFVRQIRGPFTRERGGPLEDARESLAEYVGAPSSDIFFTPNVTVALNTIARSIELKPGDEVLTTDHEYGTILATWERASEKAGARVVQHPVELPVTTHADFVEDFWKSVTPATRVILMSHITSATALILPVEEICKRARQVGILTVIDGAHAVGQLDLDLQALAADYYTSNCHKWLCTPKGSAFLYVHPDHQEQLEPLVISWAWVHDQSFSLIHEMWGTRDLSAFLSIPAAIQFYADHDWPSVRAQCHRLLVAARQRIDNLTGLTPIAPEGEGWFQQMAAMALPEHVKPAALWQTLFEEYHIESQPTRWCDQGFLRLSIQGYNTDGDINRLVDALENVLSGQIPS